MTKVHVSLQASLPRALARPRTLAQVSAKAAVPSQTSSAVSMILLPQYSTQPLASASQCSSGAQRLVTRVKVSGLHVTQASGVLWQYGVKLAGMHSGVVQSATPSLSMQIMPSAQSVGSDHRMPSSQTETWRLSTPVHLVVSGSQMRS